MRRMLPAAALLAAACSVVPSRDWPPHELQQVRAVYRADGAPIAVPMSGPELTILSFEVAPLPAAEFFRDGRRYLQPPTDCHELVIRCRYRAYAVAGAAPLPPASVFAGAAQVTIEDS